MAFNMNNIIEKSIKKKLLLVISNGTIHRDCMRSVHELTANSKNKFELILHICNEKEQYMDVLERFTLNSVADVIIFVNSAIGFKHDSIYDIFDRALNSDKMVGVCAPTSVLNLSRINSTNFQHAEVLSRSYDIHTMNKNICVEQDCSMKVRGFQLTDIVGISLKLTKRGERPIDLSRGFLNMKNECILITKHKVSNNGIDGCLLEHLQCIQKVREENNKVIPVTD